MPIKKNKVNPHIAREYYQRRGLTTRSEAVSTQIEKSEQNNTARLQKRREAMKKAMVDGGLCSCLGG